MYLKKILCLIIMNNNIHIISHRGASGYCIDNSYESINRAVDIGSKIIEIDIRLTKDLKLVLSHGEKYLIGKRYKKIANTLLSKLDNIPELNKILLTTPEQIIFYLDIKCEDNEIIFIKQINAILHKYPNRVFYIASFSHKFISLFTSSCTNYRSGIIFKLFNSVIYDTLKHKVDFIVTEISQTDEFKSFLKIKNKTKYLYTINNLSLIDNYINDIDGIITDYPDIMLLNQYL